MQERIITAIAILGALSLVGGSVWVVIEIGDELVEPAPVAHLMRAIDDVSIQRAGRSTWETVEEGLSLAALDSVRTEAGSKATVAYSTGLSVDLDPKTHLVVTAPRRDDGGRDFQEVALASGGIRGTIGPVLAAAGWKDIVIAREPGATKARLTPGSPTGEPLRYRVHALDDETTELAVLAGTATVDLNGESLDLASGHAIVVERAETGEVRLTERTSLAERPSLVSPPNESLMDLDTAPPAVELSWEAAREEDELFRVQVATDFAFLGVLADEMVQNGRHRFIVPETGTYYWRAATVDTDGRAGIFGLPRRFSVLSVASDTAPPVEHEVVDVDDLDDVDLAAISDVEADRDVVDPEPDDVPESPSETASSDAFELTARVVGAALQRRVQGRGEPRPVRGRVELSAGDVLRAERWSTLRLGRNSTLQLEADTEIRLSRATGAPNQRLVELSLIEGGVVADLGANAEVATVVIEANGDSVTVSSDAKTPRVRTLKLDDGLRVIAMRGEASVQAAGRTHAVAAGRALDQPADGSSPRIRSLPGNPQQTEPAPNAELPALDSPPEVVLKWRPIAEASSYRVRIYSGGSLHFQGISRSSRLVNTSLPPGEYRWSVSAITDDGLESLDPPRRSFSVVRDDRPPQITISTPEDGATVEASSVEVSGSTEQGVRVKIGGQDIDVDEQGRFRAEVDLEPGSNQIVIEAVNRANAVSFRTLRVRQE